MHASILIETDFCNICTNKVTILKMWVWQLDYTNQFSLKEFEKSLNNSAWIYSVVYKGYKCM